MDLGCLIAQVLRLYSIALFARIILAWFPLQPGGAMSSVYGVLYSVTEPILGPVRRAMPNFGMIDFSPIVIFIGISFISSAIC